MPKLCKIEDCGKPSRRYGLCVMHSTRLERHGDPSVTKHRPNGTAMRFLHESVLPYQGDECLTWPFSRCKGYAQMNIGKRHAYVSRYILETLSGPAPSPDHEAAHSCGNGHLGCVNPKHLRWAHRLENREDMLLHGTRYRGEAHYLAKLTEADVREIRTLQNTMNYREIGERFGVSQGVVGHVIRGTSWAWLK